MGKISDYPVKTVVHDDDLMDISNTEDRGATYDESQKLKVSEFLTFIGPGGIFNPLNNNMAITPPIAGIPFTALIDTEMVWDGKSVFNYTGASDTPFYENDFSDGTLGDCTTSGDAIFTVVNNQGSGDLFSAKSGTIADSQTSSLFLTQNTTVDSTVFEFDYKLSTEEDFDGLQVYIDDSLVLDRRTNTVNFDTVKLYLIGVGSHTIEWRYRKDVGSSGGDDAVWIDNIKLTNFNARFNCITDGLFSGNVVVLGSSYFNSLQVQENIVTKNISISDTLKSKTVTAGPLIAGSGSFHSNAAYNVDIEGVSLGMGENFMTFRGDNVRLFIETSNTYNNSSDGISTGRIFASKSGQESVATINLVAGRSLDAASHISSRLQVGRNSSIADQSNIHTIYSAGDVYSEGSIVSSEYSIPNPTGTVLNVDWANGNFQIVNLSSATGDLSLDFLNSENGGFYSLKIIQGTTARSLIYETDLIDWGDKVEPTLSTAAGSKDMLTFGVENGKYTGAALLNVGTKDSTGAPVNTALPVVSGTPNEGQLLSVTNGSWTGTPTFTYQWLKDGAYIDLETSSTYTTIVGDLGSDISCMVRGSNNVAFTKAISNSLTIV